MFSSFMEPFNYHIDWSSDGAITSDHSSPKKNFCLSTFTPLVDVEALILMNLVF